MALQGLYYFSRKQNLQQNRLINPGPSSNNPMRCSVGFFLSTGKQAISYSDNLLYFWCWVFLNNLAFRSHTKLPWLLQQWAKTAVLSAAASARGTARPLHLLSLSSRFNHHCQSHKGFSRLYIALCVCAWGGIGEGGCLFLLWGKII